MTDGISGVNDKVLSLEAQEYIVYALGDRGVRNNYSINAFILCHISEKRVVC